MAVDGADASIAMAREDRAQVWAGVTDSDVVDAIATRNALVADAEPTTTTHPVEGHALVQRESDLALVRRLTRRNGYVWWVTATEQGAGTLHFRPAPVGEPASGELAINLADHAVEQLHIAWDAERPTAASAMQVDPRSKAVLDVTSGASPLNALGSSAFEQIATGTRLAWVAAAADDAADLLGRTGAVLAAGTFFARARGVTTTARARTILRRGTVVELRGAGTRHSGPWLCWRVRHVIDATTHTMHFELARNGWGT
jgi:phage protein D